MFGSLNIVPYQFPIGELRSLHHARRTNRAAEIFTAISEITVAVICKWLFFNHVAPYQSITYCLSHYKHTKKPSWAQLERFRTTFDRLHRTSTFSTEDASKAIAMLELKYTSKTSESIVSIRWKFVCNFTKLARHLRLSIQTVSGRISN